MLEILEDFVVVAVLQFYIPALYVTLMKRDMHILIVEFTAGRGFSGNFAVFMLRLLKEPVVSLLNGLLLSVTILLCTKRTTR